MQRFVYPYDLNVGIVQQVGHKGQSGQARETPRVRQRHKLSQNVTVRKANASFPVSSTSLGMEQLRPVVKAEQPGRIQEHQVSP